MSTNDRFTDKPTEKLESLLKTLTTIITVVWVVIALYLAFIVYLIINGKFSDNVLAIVPMTCLFPALLPSVLNRSAIKAELAKRNGNSGSDE